MTKQQFSALLAPLMEAAAAMTKLSERLIFWGDVSDYAHACVAAEVAIGAADIIDVAEATDVADITTGTLHEMKVSDVPANVKEATRRIKIIFSPYAGRELTEGMMERIRIDSQKVLDELGIKGHVEARSRGIVIIADPGADAGAEGIDPIDKQIEAMPSGAERDFMTAVDTLVILVTKLAAPQRDIELRKLASYMRRRTGEISRKYDTH